MNIRSATSSVYLIVIVVCLAFPVKAQSPKDASAAGVDYADYMANMQRQIKRQWHPPDSNKSVRSTVLFKVKKTGEVFDVKIEYPSDNSQIDQASIDAVKAASPLEPPPGGIEVPIEFTFDYNAYRQKKAGDNPFWKVRAWIRTLNSESIGFVVGALVGFIIIALIIVKLSSLGKPPKGDKLG